MKGGLGTVLRDALRLSAPYFRSDQWRSAWLLLVSIIAMNFFIVYITILLNGWNKAWYDTLQNKDAVGFITLLLSWRNDDSGFTLGFAPIVAIYIPVSIYITYLQQWLTIRWRTWMTERTLGSWMSDRAYYTISLQNAAGGTTDNPDQRIAEDIRSFTNDTLDFGLRFIKNVSSFVSFAIILWGLSGSTAIFGVTIPGYLLIAVVLYAVIGTTFTHLVGRPLAGIEFRRQKVEADFRFALVRIRENAEGVALYNGARAERLNLLDRFTGIVANYRQFMSRTKLLNALTLVYTEVGVIFPFIVASPRYFSGEIMLGGMMQIVSAFSRVQVALSWFINLYADLAVWRATVGRLTQFQQALATAHGLAAGGVRVAEGAGPLGLEGVTLALPDGRILLRHGAVEMPQGRSTAITGRSGSGKSTLFRAIAGIWPFGSGTVRRPAGTQLFLPQRPYIPLGTLRQAVTYPAPQGTIGDAAILQALFDAGLGTLVPELDTDQPWAQRLSGGEQQRLAVARALLLRPDWLFMDEATASLDAESERELFAILRARLPNTTMISIAHHAAVAASHDAVLVLRDGVLAARLAAAAE